MTDKKIIRRKAEQKESTVYKDGKTAFYYRAFFRHIDARAEDNGAAPYGGAMAFVLCRREDGTVKQRLLQTMKSEDKNEKYFWAPSHLHSVKTNIQSYAEALTKKEKCDLYASIGLYWGSAHKNGRQLKEIKEIDRIVIDIDGPEHRVMTLKEKSSVAKDVQSAIGKADFVVNSGSGIQIHYLFSPITKIFAAEKAYNKLVAVLDDIAQKSIISVSGCKVDRLTPTSVYRLPYTYNSHSKTKTSVLEYSYLEPLDFAETCLQFGIFPYTPYKKKISEPEKPSVQKTYDKKSSTKKVDLNYFYTCLTHDYSVLIKKYGYGKGYRNAILYCYAYNIQKFDASLEKLLADAHKINLQFSSPLSDSEVSEIVRSAMRQLPRHRYHLFSFISQLNWMGIDASLLDQEYFLLPITEREKQKRRKDCSKYQAYIRKLRRQDEKEEFKYKIVDLLYSGKSISEVSRETGLSRNTIRKYRDELYIPA